MNEFSRILVPVDGSKGSEKAVEKAIGLARLSKGSIDFLYVANLTGVTGGAHVANEFHLPEDVLASIRESGNIALDHILKAVPEDVPAKRYVQTGLPAEEIIAFAEKHHSDIIVVGSRGLNAAASLMLGSVSQFLLERATCPVLVVK